MKHIFRTLLGLVLMVLVFSGCEDPSRLEIPEGATVEFVLDVNSQVSTNFDAKTFYAHLSRYLLGLESDKNGEHYEYPKDYDRYNDFVNTSEEDFKKLYEDAFKKAFGTKYYKKGTIINLTKWTSPAKDLKAGDENPGYSQLYFLAEDVGKTDYDKTIYKNYIDYLDKKSFDKIEVHNENIKVYIYWEYTR